MVTERISSSGSILDRLRFLLYHSRVFIIPPAYEVGHEGIMFSSFSLSLSLCACACVCVCVCQLTIFVSAS